MSEQRMPLREGSRREWASKTASLTDSQIKTGALLRIADATEKMCMDREKLERDYKYMREQRDRYHSMYEAEKLSNTGLKGVIGRMRKQIKALKEGES